MTLHRDIMNIPVPRVDYSEFGNKIIAYKSGHRDARHSAAEMCVEYEQLLEAIESHFGSGIIGVIKRSIGYDTK